MTSKSSSFEFVYKISTITIKHIAGYIMLLLQYTCGKIAVITNHDSRPRPLYSFRCIVVHVLFR